MKIVEVTLKAILRSPLHHVLSKSLMIVRYTGRRTGRPITLVVQYVEADGYVWAWPARAETKTWWRNFRGGHPAEVVVRGEEKPAVGEAIVDEPEAIADVITLYLERYPRTAKVLGLGPDQWTDRSALVRAAADQVVVRFKLEG